MDEPESACWGKRQPSVLDESVAILRRHCHCGMEVPDVGAPLAAGVDCREVAVAGTPFC